MIDPRIAGATTSTAVLVAVLNSAVARSGRFICGVSSQLLSAAVLPAHKFRWGSDRSTGISSLDSSELARLEKVRLQLRRKLNVTPESSPREEPAQAQRKK